MEPESVAIEQSPIKIDTAVIVSGGEMKRRVVISMVNIKWEDDIMFLHCSAKQGYMYQLILDLSLIHI